MAFINIPGKDNNTTLSPDEFNYFVNKVNSLKLAILQGSGFVGSLRISDVPDIDGWYFASETGTYTNAGNLVIGSDGNLNIIIVSNFGQTFSIVSTPIPLGEAVDKNFIFDQGMPSSIWTIQHNLNKYPSACAVDTAKSIVVGQIEYIDLNNLTITFNSSFSGEAYLN